MSKEGKKKKRSLIPSRKEMRIVGQEFGKALKTLRRVDAIRQEFVEDKTLLNGRHLPSD